MLKISQEWDCDTCKIHVVGGLCNGCGGTFTEYLKSKGKKVYGDAG